MCFRGSIRAADPTIGSAQNARAPRIREPARAYVFCRYVRGLMRVSDSTVAAHHGRIGIAPI
jgi:hypothetical protein